MTQTLSAVRTPRPRTRPTSRNPWQDLRVERTDIAFATVHPGVLRVELTIRNAGPDRTPETAAMLRSAPLGAFVPWQPLTPIAVPPLFPGQTVVIGDEFRYENPRPLGTPDKLPPNRVLTALGLGEPNRDPQRNPQRNPQPIRAPGISPDVMALLGQGGVHWGAT